MTVGRESVNYYYIFREKRDIFYHECAKCFEVFLCIHPKGPKISQITIAI